jgi:sulfoacetaldehyde dehydrogenase
MGLDYKTYVASLVARASKAQTVAEGYTQERIDELCAAIAYVGTRPDFAAKIAASLVKESGMGIAEHKVAKIMTKVKGAWRDMKGEKSVGIIERDEARGIVKLAKPVGVIGALIPVTNGEATPLVKAIMALKGRNAIILAPHPKAKATNVMATGLIRATLQKYGAPEDLVIAVDPEYVSVDCSGELMKQVDLVLATGGTPMVRSAYSSGTPAIGVGTGNACTIIDGSTDLDTVANQIMRSKTFDNATSCSTENACLVQEKVYAAFVAAMQKQGGYLIARSSPEKAKLQAAMWPDGHALNRFIVAQSPRKIAEIAGLALPDTVKFFMVEEDGIGADFLFTGEKLSVVTTLYRYGDFEEALAKAEKIMAYQGLGHSCGIHTSHDDRVLQLAERIKVSRIMVNQPQCLANSGAWTNGIPMSLTLGCGTWGKNSVSHNVTWKDLINTTWVSWPIPSTQPTDEDLFPASVREFNKG